MNKIEQLKAEKAGLDIIQEIPQFAQQGWESITEADIERLKWAGVFFRRHTPGFFMMRVRITNGITDVRQLRALAGIAAEFGQGRLCWVSRGGQFPRSWERLSPEELTGSLWLANLLRCHDRLRVCVAMGCRLLATIENH